MKPLRIIAFAYACEPGQGSEPGAGWAWARMLASLGEVWVITRANNREAIESALGTTPEKDSMRFVYVDLPAKARFWKRGQRGVRAYYLVWQVAAVRAARRLAADVRPDLVWHVTLANSWLGSLAPLTGVPFVYGPVGGGVGTPWRMLTGAPIGAVGYEVVRAVARTLGRFANPAARLAWSRATLILAQNEDTRQWFPRRHRRKAVVFQNAVLEEDLGKVAHAPAAPTRTALYAGRLIYWKRPDLAVSAVLSLDGWRLLVCGTGPEEERLRRQVTTLGGEERVEFLGWQPREDLFRLMRDGVDAFVFPSIHDESPWIIAEAMACGLPVVCCDRGGPPTIAGPAGVVVPATTAAETSDRLAAALEEAKFPSPESVLARAADFTREAQLARLRTVLSEAGIA